MTFLIIASIVVISSSVWLVFRSKQSRKQAAYLPFRKKGIFQTAKVKRRRRALLDSDRGKVIPFPITPVSPQGDGPSDTRGRENK